jgi:hypothetical protein
MKNIFEFGGTCVEELLRNTHAERSGNVGNIPLKSPQNIFRHAVHDSLESNDIVFVLLGPV